MAAPNPALGDGALGFWAAVREVFPEAREKRCWFHKQANALAAQPKSAHPNAIKAMQEICNAEAEDHARTAAKQFEQAYGARYPKAVAKIIDDLDVLLQLYRYSAAHLMHLRSTNPIESPSPRPGCAPKDQDHAPRVSRWPTS